MITRKVIEQLLDLARWAPSGDNSQPWRFELGYESHVVVHGFDTRDHCVYDLDGRPSQISLGALLETLSIAASAHGLTMQAQRRADVPDCTPTYDIQFESTRDRPVDPLIAAITARCVKRQAMGLRALTQQQKQALERSVAPDYRIMWLEGFNEPYTLPPMYCKHHATSVTMIDVVSKKCEHDGCLTAPSFNGTAASARIAFPIKHWASIHSQRG